MSAVAHKAWLIDHLVQDGNVRIFQGYCTLKQTGHVHGVWLCWNWAGVLFFMCFSNQSITCGLYFSLLEWWFHYMNIKVCVAGSGVWQTGMCGCLQWCWRTTLSRAQTRCRLTRAVFWEQFLVSYSQSCPCVLVWRELADFLQKKAGERDGQVSTTREFVMECSAYMSTEVLMWCSSSAGRYDVMLGYCMMQSSIPSSWDMLLEWLVLPL